jgi:hypothetical protein
MSSRFFVNPIFIFVEFHAVGFNIVYNVCGTVLHLFPFYILHLYANMGGVNVVFC